jgi:uncharacterized protein
VNLRDQLLKAGLVSKKDAKKAAHENRVERSKTGAEVNTETQAVRDAAKTQLEAERRNDRERQLAETERLAREKAEELRRSRELIDAQRAAQAAEKATRDARKLARDMVIELKEGGAVAVHFAKRDGRIGTLYVTNAFAVQIYRGSLAIAEAVDRYGCEYVVVRDDVAANMDRLDPETVRLWNRD